MATLGTYTVNDGRQLQVSVLTCPIHIEDQMTLIELWRTEWSRGDYDYLDSINGAYSRTLHIDTVVGRMEGQAVATASVCYPCVGAEVCTIGSVLTRRDYRGLGIAAQLTNIAVERAFAAGCKVSYLGATRSAKCVYLRCGFEWWNGGVMRRAAREADGCESQFFAAGQKTWLRQATWGDLPGTACFVIQPCTSLVLDYPRGLMSGRYVSLQRCVSNFPLIYDHVTQWGGAMCVLVGEQPHRVLGFGTVTPGPGTARSHTAAIDVALHDNYESEIDKMIAYLISQASQQQIESLQAYVASWDRNKANRFKRFGFRQIASLPGQLRVRGEHADVLVLEARICEKDS